MVVAAINLEFASGYPEVLARQWYMTTDSMRDLPEGGAMLGGRKAVVLTAFPHSDSATPPDAVDQPAENV